MPDAREPLMFRNGRRDAAGTVAVILAIGIATAVNTITFTLLWAVITDRLGNGLGENTTQVLVAWGGAIVSVLSGYVGYVVGRLRHPLEEPRDE